MGASQPDRSSSGTCELLHDGRSSAEERVAKSANAEALRATVGQGPARQDAERRPQGQASSTGALRSGSGFNGIEVIVIFFLRGVRDGRDRCVSCMSAKGFSSRRGHAAVVRVHLSLFTSNLHFITTRTPFGCKTDA